MVMRKCVQLQCLMWEAVGKLESKAFTGKYGTKV